MATCSVLPVSAVLHGQELAQQVVNELLQHAGSEIVVVDAVDAAAVDQPLAVLVVSGGTEGDVLKAWRARQQLVPGEPLVLIAHRGHNSLPAALEALARVQADGGRAGIVMLDTDAQNDRDHADHAGQDDHCLLYTSPSPRD